MPDMNPTLADQNTQVGYDTSQFIRNLQQQLGELAGENAQLRCVVAERDAIITSLVGERERNRAADAAAPEAGA